MNSKELLKKANSIIKEKQFSDESYNEIYKLFSDASVTKWQRDNSRAILKKDLALQFIFADILALLSILFSVGIVIGGSIDSLLAAIVVLIFIALYAFKLIPGIKKENYVLSVIEDI